MGNFFSNLLDVSDFPARWWCGNWSSFHGWLHIVSDLATWAAYFTIPLVLILFIRKRPDLPFPRIFWLFSAFIFACGTVHLLEAVIFWHPIYRVSALVKLFTAIISWVTVLAILPVLPKALALPGLKTLNDKLQLEVDQRRAFEDRLRAESEELERVNNELRSFSNLAVGRELRMIELKREINELLAQQNKPPRYDVDARADGADEVQELKES